MYTEGKDELITVLQAWPVHGLLHHVSAEGTPCRLPRDFLAWQNGQKMQVMLKGAMACHINKENNLKHSFRGQHPHALLYKVQQYGRLTWLVWFHDAEALQQGLDAKVSRYLKAALEPVVQESMMMAMSMRPAQADMEVHDSTPFSPSTTMWNASRKDSSACSKAPVIP